MHKNRLVNCLLLLLTLLVVLVPAPRVVAQQMCFTAQERARAEQTAKVYRAPDPGYDPVLGYNPANGPRRGAPPVDENASAQGKKQRSGECDAEQRYAGWFNGEKKSGRVHIDLTGWREARVRTGRNVSWLAFILYCVMPLSPEFRGRHFRKVEILAAGVFPTAV